MPDTRTKHKEIPFSGKFYTTEPAGIGSNFRTLKNMRYTDTHIKGIAGMTKQNATAMTTCVLTRNAFHFSKSQPSESHVLVHALTTAGVGHVKENTAVIPATATFTVTALLTCATGFGVGRFSDAPDGQMIYCNGVDTCIWGGVEAKEASALVVTTALTTAASTFASMKDYTDAMNNTKTDADNVVTCGGTYKTFLVGSPRPAQGAKLYFTATVNTTANTLEVKESTATVWTTLTVTSDGTRTGGTTSFAQTGTVSWASTVATTKPKYIEGYYLYWYQFTIDDGSAELYHITLDLPFQSIIDMWDGIYRDILRFYVTTTTQTDKTLSVFKDDYDQYSASSYADLSSLTATTQFIEAGFGERQTALYFAIPPGYENSTATTTATVYYWNGSAWATVGTISDGTATGGISFAKSGVISWNNTSLSSEQKIQYANALPLYYYKVAFSQNLDTAVRVNYVGGITASKTVNYFKFPVFAQGRVLLCCDMAGEKNKATCSSKYMPQVYNGFDSVDVYFGEDGELTCGTELFSQFGSSIYSLILMFKDNETWIVSGLDINEWENNTFLISSAIGCPAPLTLKTINLASEPGAGVNRALAIWQGANGVYMSDGRAPIPIHHDIKEYFDPVDSRCIPASKIGDSVGFIDYTRQEYHLLLASGTELVYDIARNKWFEIDRGSDLQCGVSVHDTDGNAYAYGFLDTGYMERLENGTTFDGTTITHTVQFGDIPLDGLAVETRLSAVRLITVAGTNDVTLTVYSDTSSTGTDKTMTHTNTGYRVAFPKFTEKLKGDPFFSFKLVTTAGFEPLALVATSHPVHEDS